MSNFKKLVQFIDDVIKKGEGEIPEAWGEGVGFEKEGCVYLKEFNDKDWAQLQNGWREKSDHWIKCLIDLLSQVECQQSKEMLINIALQGSDESALDAIEFVRSFISELDPSVIERLEDKSWKVISSRMK